MDFNLLREAVTVVSFATFMGIVWYAAHPGNKRHFDRAAQLPPDEDGK